MMVKHLPTVPPDETTPLISHHPSFFPPQHSPRAGVSVALLSSPTILKLTVRIFFVY